MQHAEAYLGASQTSMAELFYSNSEKIKAFGVSSKEDLDTTTSFLILLKTLSKGLLCPRICWSFFYT